jgi:antitoxin component YwqK of YwqJK toxin-antitoxin module
MLKSEQVYEAGDMSSVKLYSQDGKTVIAEGNFRGKAKHGMWKLYKDGKLLTEEVYKDDKKHGMTKTYSDGNVIEEIPYNEGKIDGVHRYFLPNGKLYSETNYKNGIKDGAYKVYEGNSSPVIFGTYKKGKKDGDWTSLDEKGNVSEVLKYKDGVLTNKKEINKERNKRFEEIATWATTSDGFVVMLACLKKSFVPSFSAVAVILVEQLTLNTKPVS